ncbi:MAG: nitroreductase family protein [Gemmatimonadetes bacterium]|nr:nitroreductase family protein [Gemmatimonadota bacterium]
MLSHISTLNVTEAAESRRSIRAYKDVEVPDDDLREILRVTGLAPSAFNAQPWRFVVVKDAAVRAQLAEAAYGQKQVTAAPVVIAIYSDMNDTLETIEETIHPGVPADRRAPQALGFRNNFAKQDEAEREQWAASQSYIALGYLTLAASGMGYATSAMLGFKPDEVKKILGLPSHVRVPALVALGVADEEGFTHHRHDIDRIARFI